MRSFFVALPFFLFACGGSVSILERSAASGSINVTGSEEAVRSRADQYMRSHCSNGYTLVDEHPTSDGWRMKYRCNEARFTETEASVETLIVRY